MLEVKPVRTNSEYKAFVQFPFTLYKGDKNWVPSMRSDELKALQKDTNPAFSYCEVEWWLAWKNGKVVGRMGAIIHKPYNEKMGKKLARFTRLEFENDPNVIDSLLKTAEKWALSKGMEEIHGPLGFSNLDHQGMLIEGFDYLPSVASEYHKPYYLSHLERNGYQKEEDWVEFRLTIDQQIPEKALKLNKIIQERYKLKVHHFTDKATMLPFGPKVFDLLNEAFADLFSMAPLNEKMRDFYIKKYFNLLNPKFVKIITDEESKVVGFIIGLPSMSEAMQKAGGSLWPFGWWYLMNALKKPQVIDLLLTAVHPKMQGQGVPALLITALQQEMLDNGVKYAETTGMLEANEKAIQFWKNYDHIQHKRKRCFIKTLKSI